MFFASPLLLLLLVLVPVFAWIGWPGREAPGRAVLALALRLVSVVCLVLALAGLQLVRRIDDPAVVFLVDVSDSMPAEAIAAATDFVRSALEGMGAEDRAAVILFGADSLVERPMSGPGPFSRITSAPVTTQTDLAEAIRLGTVLFPPGYARRMVILSDGAQTTGDALQAAEYAAALDVQIIVLPFVSRLDGEVRLSDLHAPTRLRPGQEFDLEVTVDSSQPSRATIRILAGEQVVYEQAHQLRRGPQTLSLPLSAGSPGFVRYQVQIDPDQDRQYQNNRLDTFSQVEGPPRVLVVAPPAGETMPGGAERPDEDAALLQALQSAGYEVTAITPELLPAGLPALARFDSVILVDVPARDLGLNQMEAIRAYIRDLGGGLLVIGGPTSFGVGGYYGTALEEALPVEMRLRDEQRLPSIAIVFVIDRSGSMSETSGGDEKLELAKEATARSVELLLPTDRVGVVAFDDTAGWVVPLTTLSDPENVVRAVGSIRTGGGTDILAGLQAVAQVLPDDDATVKHIILLTDGGADPGGIPELVQRLHNEDHITLTTVAIGHDAAAYLEDLAALGGGRFHFTAEASSISSIFTEETSLAARAYIVEESFFPTRVNSSPILENIEGLPRLHGYVAATPKELSQVILNSDQRDPVLSVWHYGLGRSVAFTSDATGRWGRDWVAWRDFGAFWAQAAGYTLGDLQQADLEMRVVMDGERALLTLEAYDPSGAFLNAYEIQANVVSPEGDVQSLALRQVAPGRYEASFAPAAQGVYLIRFDGQPADGLAPGFSETAGWTMSYSPEYGGFESDPDLLVRLATVTGGQVATSEPADVFAHDRVGGRQARPLSTWLIVLAALLFPFDIAARRLNITSDDLRRAREFLDGLWVPSSPRAAAAAQPTPLMRSLLRARTRARLQLPNAEADQAVTDPAQERAQAVPVGTPPDASEAADISAAEDSRTTAQVLLESKKRKTRN